MTSFLCWLSHQSQAQGDQLLYADGKAQLEKNKYSEKAYFIILCSTHALLTSSRD